MTPPTTTVTAKLRRKVHTKTQIADDLELHVSTLRVAGQTLLEIRQFIPSLKQYGRGVTVPFSAKVVEGIVIGIDKHVDDEAAR